MSGTVTACAKHRITPAWGYSECPGCEVEGLRAEIEQLKGDLAGYKMGAKAEADAGDEARAEVRRLNTMLIERETIRIGHGLQRHDDQKLIDELVSLGIQQDKDEIARLRAENERWRQNYEHLIEQHMPRTGHGCEEGWSRVVKARELQEQVDQFKAENVQLLAAMMHIMNEVDGNLREIARDLINYGVSTYPDSPANPNDIYEYCDTIERLIAGALPKEQS